MRILIILSILLLIIPKVNATERIFQQSRYIPGQSETEGYRRAIDADIRTIIRALQGRIAFGKATDGNDGENIEGEFQVVTITVAADTEFEVAHTLGRTPEGYILLKNSRGGVVYDGSSSNDSDSIFLRNTLDNSSTNSIITLFIF